ncbi:hypothetical protein ACWDYH_23995 [Nocardia goodfellowii]
MTSDSGTGVQNGRTALSGILPIKLRDVFLSTVGVYNSMEKFTGRK